jgi:hypothetical protein
MYDNMIATLKQWPLLIQPLLQLLESGISLLSGLPEALSQLLPHAVSTPSTLDGDGGLSGPVNRL